MLAGGVVAIVALALLRGRARLAGVIAAVLAVGIVGWNLTGEIGAAAGTNSISRTQAATLRHPFTWVDDITKQQPTLYLGEGEADQNPEWMLEFWNRSIVTVGSFDGSVGGPGPAGSPNLTENGSLYWTPDPANPGRQYAFAVEDYPCIDFAGTYRGRHFYRAGGGTKVWHLIQLTHPNRLRAVCNGIYPDGWSGAADSAYYRFSDGANGWLRVVVSRKDWGGKTGPSPVSILVAPLVITDRTPARAEPHEADDPAHDRQRADESLLAPCTRRPLRRGRARPEQVHTAAGRPNVGRRARPRGGGQLPVLQARAEARDAQHM